MARLSVFPAFDVVELEHEDEGFERSRRERDTTSSDVYDVARRLVLGAER